MADKDRSSRRDFLASSAKVAALAGLATAGGCATTPAGEPRLVATAGPMPRVLDEQTTIRFGLIGIGGRGQGLLRTLLKHKNISVKAIADPSEHNSKRAAEMVKECTGELIEIYKGPEDYKTKLLARDDIDAVLSATPCYMHGPVYLACFAAGKHFYGEKPMCTEANEADALVEAQKKNPLVKGQIGFQRRATKIYTEGIKRIRDGEIGDPIDGRGAWNNSWGPIGRPEEGARIWLGRRAKSGDWMLEQACHTWDVLNWVADAVPVAASGIGRRDCYKEMDPERDVTDYYIAHLEYPGGFCVDFEHSWICPHNDGGRFTGVFEHVAGMKGGLALNEGRIFYRDKDKQPVHYDLKEGDHTAISIAAFLDALRKDKPVCSDVVNGRMATYTGLLVRKAVDERRWVSMKEIM
jgi:predicted dehydrogenase